MLLVFVLQIAGVAVCFVEFKTIEVSELADLFNQTKKLAKNFTYLVITLGLHCALYCMAFDVSVLRYCIECGQKRGREGKDVVFRRP